MSSNDRGDEPRVTPSPSARQRPNRSAAGAQRVENDPRAEAASKRPAPSARSTSGRPRNGSGVDVTADLPRSRPSNPPLTGPVIDAANGPVSSGAATGPAFGPGNTPTAGPIGARPGPPDNVVAIDGASTTSNRPSRRAKPLSNGSSLARPADARDGRPSGTPEPGPSAVPPVAHVGDRPPVASPRPTSPITGPVPSTVGRSPGPPVTSPVIAVPVGRSAAPPAPAALAPAAPPHAVPLPPSVFDDEAHPTGAIPFEGLFDPEHDEAGMPRRQRAVQFTQTGRRSRPRLRRVTRVVRHVDPWSVFKVALCFSLVLYGVCLTAGVLLWNVAYTTGTIDNVQRFFESFGWDTFRFKGGELYHNAWIAGLFAALGLTGLIVLAVTLFNLITDLVGGIRVTVLEEEVVERNPVVRGPLLRRRTRPVSMITPDHEFGDDPDSPDSPPHLG